MEGYIVPQERTDEALEISGWGWEWESEVLERPQQPSKLDQRGHFQMKWMEKCSLTVLTGPLVGGVVEGLRYGVRVV